MAERDDYDQFMETHHARYDRAVNGEIVTRGKDRPIQHTRQADSTWWLNSQDFGKPEGVSALQDWDVFMHHIREHTGEHTHQGGLVIYIVEGRGYTQVGDRRVDWKAGDLLLLPITVGGIAHQHFNLNDDEPARWVALIYRPMQDALGSHVQQLEEAPGFDH
jgi:cupin superfamily acireductone dioxygenase involved in methionine salvage